MSNKSSQYLYVTIGVVIAFAFNAMLGFPNEALFMITIFVGALIGFIVSATKISQKDRALSSVMSVDKEKRMITLHERSNLLNKVISIKPVYESYLKYNPLEITYTGATVGGVSMGGFHTSGNDYSTKLGGKSGKFQLCARVTKAITSEDEYVFFDKIRLTSVLAQQAADNRVVSKYLRGTTLVLENIVEDKLASTKQDIATKAASDRDWQTLSLMANDRRIATALTREECQCIYDWVCGR